MIIDKFPAGVIEKLKYYVYVYVDPTNDEVFYVGKGKGNRCFSHLTETGEAEKVTRIFELKDAKTPARIDILAYGLDEPTALKVEAAAIDLLGINNLTNLCKGHHSEDVGRKTVRDIVAELHSQPIQKFSENIMLVRINQAYYFGISDADLYDATRGIWPVKKESRDKVQYALAVYDGLVREVYKVLDWYDAGSTFYATREGLSTLKDVRSEFIGNIAEPEVRKKYLYKSVKHLFLPSAQNPIMYAGPDFGRNTF